MDSPCQGKYVSYAVYVLILLCWQMMKGLIWLNFGYSPYVIQFWGVPLEDNVPSCTVYLESSYAGVDINIFL